MDIINSYIKEGDIESALNLALIRIEELEKENSNRIFIDNEGNTTFDGGVFWISNNELDKQKRDLAEINNSLKRSRGSSRIGYNEVYII